MALNQAYSKPYLTGSKVYDTKQKNVRIAKNANNAIIVTQMSFFLKYWKTQKYTFRVLQTIQMKLILLCVWAEPGRFGQH